GEHVLEALLQLFPNADIYTLFYEPRGVSLEINKRAIFPSTLNRLPGVRRYYRNLLPFFPRVMDRFKLHAEYELVISTSPWVAHGIHVPATVPHVTYCFSPMRYLYDQQEAYSAGGARFSTWALNHIAPKLRDWDAAAAKRCGNYISISNFVAARVKAAYSLES